ncbi:hypothetical protein F5148DRAFT_1154424, partial [Russula earlei]
HHVCLCTILSDGRKGFIGKMRAVVHVNVNTFLGFILAYVRISVIGEIDPHRPIIADKALTARGSPGFTGRGRVVGRYLRSHTHTSTPQKLASERYKDMTWDVCDKFVGPMPIAEFLSEFVPEASQARKTERIISFDKRSVSHNEDHFVSPHIQGGIHAHVHDRYRQSKRPASLIISHFVNTTAKQDKAILGRPDIVIYRKREGHQENEQLTSLDWRAVDVWIENKKGKEDIFRNLTHMRREAGVECHVRWTERAYHFRVFSYSIILFGKAEGRLLRWDRSGAIYTEIFDWTKNPNTLSEFIWRLNSLTFAQRGYDTTVTSVSKNDKGVGDAQSTLAVYMDVEKIEVEDLRQILVNDDHAMDGQPKPYIIWKPIWETKTLFGRSTFGFVCHDIERNKLVYLKDYWRTNFPGIEKEGDIYHDLLEAKPLSTFRSTRELCQVIQDAMIAHTDAYDKAKILHRDVSAGNILITPDRSGLLIDWDMSKRDGCDPAETTLPHGMICLSPMRGELTSCSGANHKICNSVFDGYRDVDEDGVIRGGDGKLSFLHKLMLHPDSFGFVPEPCRQIIEELRTLLKTFYDDINPKSIMPEPQAERNVRTEVKDAHEKLCSSEWVLNLITWNLESKNCLSKNIVGHDPTFSRGCRKRKAKDDDSPVEKEWVYHSTKSVEDDIHQKDLHFPGIARRLSRKAFHVQVSRCKAASHSSPASLLSTLFHCVPVPPPLPSQLSTLFHRSSSLWLVLFHIHVLHSQLVSFCLPNPPISPSLIDRVSKPPPAAFNTDLVLSGKIQTRFNYKNANYIIWLE